MVTVPTAVINLSLSFFLSSLSSGKLLEMKSTWSPGPISHTQASLSHELWKVSPGTRNSSVPSRPPPGLTNTKPSSSWGGNSLGLSQGWTSSYSSGKSSVHLCGTKQQNQLLTRFCCSVVDQSDFPRSFLSCVFRVANGQKSRI